MKKGFTRLVAIFVVLLLVASFAVGCGSTPATSTTDTTTPASTTDVTATTPTDASTVAPTTEGSTTTGSTVASTAGTTTTAAVTPAPGKASTAKITSTTKFTPPPKPSPLPAGPINLKGYTLKVTSWFSAAPLQTDFNYVQMQQRIVKLQKKYNFKFRFDSVATQELVGKLQASILAQDPIGDVLRLRDRWVIPTLAAQGLVLPAADYINLKLPQYMKYISDMGTYKGKVYGFNHFQWMNFNVCFVNETLLQKSGISGADDPVNLLNTGKWTYDNYMRLAQKVTKRNSDGSYSVYGSSLPDAGTLVRANNGYLVKLVNGKPVYNIDSPNVLKALNLRNTIYNAKIGAEKAGWDEFFAGKLGFLFDTTADNPSFMSDMKDKWTFVYYPKLPNATNYIAYREEIHMWVLPLNGKHSREVGKIWDEYTAPTGAGNMAEDDVRARTPDVATANREIDGYKKYLQTAIDYMAYDAFQWHIVSDGGYAPDLDGGMYGLVDGKLTPEAWAAKWKAPGQKLLDDVYNTFIK